jgi:hypothetical protein
MRFTLLNTGLPGGHSKREPLDPIPNSDVKPFSADDSLGFPHAKVGHCQASKLKPPRLRRGGFFVFRQSMAEPHRPLRKSIFRNQMQADH